MTGIFSLEVSATKTNCSKNCGSTFCELSPKLKDKILLEALQNSNYNSRSHTTCKWTSLKHTTWIDSSWRRKLVLNTKLHTSKGYGWPTTFMCPCIFSYLISADWFITPITISWQLNTMWNLRCAKNTEITDRFITLITCTSTWLHN
jgi:hypothetical protein